MEQEKERDAAARASRTDFAKVDAYENTAADYKELPELTDADFARGKLMRNGISRSRAGSQVEL